MERKKFLGVLSAGLPLLGANLMHTERERITVSKNNSSFAKDPLIEKAMLAMLCMQRAAWEQGTASQALIAIGREDLALLFAKDAVVRQLADGRLGIVGSDPGITDPASNGEAVLLAYKKTGDEKFKKAAEAQYNYLKNAAPKTSDGILHHVTYAKQVWSDSPFMAPPFLALMGDYDEAVKQIEGFRKYLMNPEKKLYYHQWDETKNDYSRKLLWGGGNGWTAAAIAKIINFLPKEREAQKVKLIGFGKEVIDGCIAYMRPDGLFHDVIDDSSSFVETNLGQMLAFAIYTGVKAGWLGVDYKLKADKMRQAARAKIDSFGIVQGACSSPYFDRPGTSTEAQAFFLMMESAYNGL